MSTARPRYSVLSLFDPLTSSDPSTPPRNVSSPDSDKENSSPPNEELTMTAYFNRTHQKPQPIHHVPKRRLIDIGDMTLDDMSDLAMLTEEDTLDDDCDRDASSDVDDDENVTLKFRDMAKAATPNWKTTSSGSTLPTKPPRTPLSDLSSTSDVTPVPRTKIYKILTAPVFTESSSTSDELQHSALDSVIHTVNTSGISFADAKFSSPSNATNTSSCLSPAAVGNQEQSTDSIRSPASPIVVNVDAPIMITPPSPTSEYDPSSEDIQETKQSPQQARLRLHPPNTSSQDKNRHSIDLQSSFQVHLESDSFDLLNDKVSFFQKNGMELFINELEEDDSFDINIERGKMEAAVLRDKLGSREECRVLPSEYTEHRAPEDIRDPLSVPLPDSPVEKVIPAQAFLENSPASIQSIVPKLRKRISLTQSPPSLWSGNIEVKAQAKVSPQARSIQSFSTPSSSRLAAPIQPPPPVPALRIIKRTKPVIQAKANTTDHLVLSTRSPAPETLTNANSSKTSPTPAVVPPQAVRRSYNDNCITNTAPTRPVRSVTTISNSITSSSVFSTAMSSQSGTGPRRVLASEGPVVSKTVGAGARGRAGTIIERSSTLSTGVGPRRVPVTTISSNNIVSSVARERKELAPPLGGLRPPARSVPTSMSSGLPKPVVRATNSRLPGPSIRQGIVDGSVTRMFPSRRGG